MTAESLNIVQDRLKNMKLLFPEPITEGKIDWEKPQAMYRPPINWTII